MHALLNDEVCLLYSVSLPVFFPEAIKDVHLPGVVAGLLFVDTIFLTVWFSMDPL